MKASPAAGFPTAHKPSTGSQERKEEFHLKKELLAFHQPRVFLLNSVTCFTFFFFKFVVVVQVQLSPFPPLLHPSFSIVKEKIEFTAQALTSWSYFLTVSERKAKGTPCSCLSHVVNLFHRQVAGSSLSL